MFLGTRGTEPELTIQAAISVSQLDLLAAGLMAIIGVTRGLSTHTSDGMVTDLDNFPELDTIHSESVCYFHGHTHMIQVTKINMLSSSIIPLFPSAYSLNGNEQSQRAIDAD
jgi:hypothetical protein